MKNLAIDRQRNRERDVFALRVLTAAVIASLSGPLLAAETEGDKVIVTGTRLATRTATDSQSPVDVISVEDLKKTGATDLNTVLSRLLPSFNFPRPSVTDTSDAVKPAQLRGLSPDQTLVLVNGKRRHTTAILNTNGTQGRGSAPVDLNAIPIEAIERIEVLRDGAAALYGSDAIAGVVNIILKKSPSSGEAVVGLGQYDEGDGKHSNFGVHGGISLAEQGWLHLSAAYHDQGYTNRAGADYRNPAEPRYGQVNQRYGEPDSTQRSVFANGQFNFTGGVELYAFGGYTGHDTLSAGFWRPALDSRDIPSIYPEGFLPLETSSSEDQSLVVGLRGALGDGWRWDASLNYGANTFKLHVDNSLNTSLGATSPRSFYIGSLKNGQTLFNADLSREFTPSWFKGPLALALGAEARRENYEISAGDAASYYGTGAQVFAGFRPSDSGSHARTSESLYLNLEADITEAFSAGIALRSEHYSDFGDATSAKLSARYALNSKAAIRATASTGFRAPSLAQQYYSTTTGFIGGVPYDVRTFAVSDPVAKKLGAEDLKAEKSRNLSLGLVLQPLRNLNASIDAYQIDIDDRIVLSENLTGSAVRSFLAANGYDGVDGGRYFTNAVDTRTRGVDLVGTYHLDLGRAGTTDLSLGYNYTHTDIRSIAANPAQLSENGLSLTRIGRVEQGRITKGSPSDKLSLGADYNRAEWTLHGQLTRYGEFTVYNANPAQDQTFSANWVLDLAATYRVGRVSITGGIDNVTDQYPDTVLAANSNSGILPYSNSSPYGFSGRFLYAKLGYRW